VGGGRWPTIADFAVPALLAFAQIGVTWLLTAGADQPLERGRWMACVAAILVSNVALIGRRVAPVTVLAVTVVCGGAGALAVDSGDAPVGGIADTVALFSVAVHRGRRDAMLGCVAAIAVLTLVMAPVRPGAALLTNGILDVASYVAVTALGQIRRQRKARRRELTERLAAAEHERRDAAAAERERLARDLHDVAGHHLSAVVVHSTAASRLDDPELAQRALTAAADTGRDVLGALGRLVDVVGTDSGDGRLETLLPPLCRGLARLGVPVTLTVEAPRRLRPQVTNAAYRIVQEALTNAMRYAQGAAVTVDIGGGPEGLEVEVRNAAPPEEIPAPALGGGRGIAGMRERAESLGGTLTAGPDGSGGWTVRAVLPTAAPAGRRIGWPEVLDLATIALCAALPFLVAFAPGEGMLLGWPLGASALAIAAVVGRALPLWWRRRAPYTVLAALTVIDAVWAVLAGLNGSGPMLGMLVLGCPATMVAVSSVGCYARRGTLTWPAPLLAALPWGVLFGMLGALEDESASDADAIVFGLVTGALFATLVLLPFWAWGRTIAGRGVQWEADALETVAARTGEAVLAERHRVAMGLRGTVLEHTARVVHTAEAGLAEAETDVRQALAEVAEHARAALTDMRALLDAMQDDTAT
jgi:signal transduction histidine kinase